VVGDPPQLTCSNALTVVPPSFCPRVEVRVRCSIVSNPCAICHQRKFGLLLSVEMAASITSFTPPASCSTAWLGTLQGEGGRGLRRGVGCVAGTLTWDRNCYPSATPAEAGCPVGYDTAFTWSTAAACCPRYVALVLLRTQSPQMTDASCRSFKHPGKTGSGQTDCSSEFKTNVYSGLVCAAGAAPSPATVTESCKQR